jgi:hypothetical protein
MAAVNFFLRACCRAAVVVALPAGRRTRKRKAIKEKKLPASHRMKNKPWFQKTMVF